MRLKPADLKEGDVFYECMYGMCKKFTVTEVSVSRYKVEWSGTDEKGAETNFLVTFGYEHYGPTIYSEPAYM